MAIYNAVFRIDQERPGSPSVGEPGISRRDLWLLRVLHLVPNSPPTDPSTTYLWEFLDRPRGSSAVLLDETTGLPSQTSQLTKFTPDVWGTYRIRLTINKGQYSHTMLAAVLLTNVGASSHRGWRLPAFKEIDTEGNFPGQERGYADDWDTILTDILANGFGGGGGGFTAGGDLAGSSTSQTVVGLQGRALSISAPSSGQVLEWVADGTPSWRPVSLSAPTFAQVQTALGLASSSVGFNSQKITGVLSPDDPQDAATKSYVDAIAQGLKVKPPVAAVSVAATITSLSGLGETVDGVDLDTDGMRVLLTYQGGPGGSIDDGIWVVHTGAWTRPTDFAAGGHVAAAFTFVEQGTTYAHTGWVCTNDAPADVVGADVLAFTQFSHFDPITFAGDLTGTSSSQTVVKIQTYGVDNAAPSEGDVLVYHSEMMFANWTPKALGRASTVIMPMVAGLQYADTTIYKVLGSSYGLSGASGILGHGVVTAKLHFVINVPADSTATVQLYDATNHTMIWESATITGPETGYEYTQTISLASGYARYEYWQATPTDTGGSSTCVHASISLDYATDFPVG